MNTHRYASEADLINALRTRQSSAFACLRDQYAPILLGIITKTIGNPQRAELILTQTFAAIHSEIERCPVNQPLFLWLFDIARQTAANALAANPKLGPAAIGLTPAGRIATGAGQTTPVQAPIDAQRRLLNAVLFERCTPQEASRAAGLPVETARQHLRQAFLQLREERAEAKR